MILQLLLHQILLLPWYKIQTQVQMQIQTQVQMQIQTQVQMQMQIQVQMQMQTQLQMQIQTQPWQLQNTWALTANIGRMLNTKCRQILNADCKNCSKDSKFVLIYRKLFHIFNTKASFLCVQKTRKWDIHGEELILRIQRVSRVHMRCTHPAAYCTYGILHPYCILCSSALDSKSILLQNWADYEFEFLAGHACGLHRSCKSFMRCAHNRLHSSLDYIHNNVDNAALIHWFSWHCLQLASLHWSSHKALKINDAFILFIVLVLLDLFVWSNS